MNPYLSLDVRYKKIAEEFDKLNEFQKKAILNNEKSLLLNATVGSGKTTVLINKILYLHLIKNIPLNNMLVLTFTNKAAEEIKTRFEEYGIHYNYKDTYYFGTFHSVAKKILEKEESLKVINYKKDFTIIDTDDMEEMLIRLAYSNNFDIKYKNRIIKRIEQFKMRKPILANKKYDDNINELLEVYKKEKLQNNQMDFDDLIDHCVHALKHINTDFVKYIIIDEFQDCNTIQLEMIECLIKNANVFAVGDPNQIIYSWRGSIHNIFEDFKNKTKAKVLSLPINYRSSLTILDAAKTFLNKAIDLNGIRDTGNKIIISEHNNDFLEANYLADRINEIINSGAKYNEIAILYRKQNQSKVFQDIFDNQNIPFEVSVRKSISDIPVLYWFIRLLKVCINILNKHDFIKILIDNRYGITKNLKDATDLINSNVKKSSKKTALINSIIEFRNSDIKVLDLYNYFKIDTIIKPIASEYKENKAIILKFLSNLDEYITLNNYTVFDGIKEYLSSSALYGAQIIEEKINMAKNSVKLMTIHSSKGLEFKYVFIVGANEGILPLVKRNSPDYTEEYNEEKRLFFVGITRAKDMLEITYQLNTSDFGAYGIPSEFIEMIPSHLKISNKIKKTPNKKIINSIASKISENRKSKKENDNSKNKTNITEIKVKHNKYGLGVITVCKDGYITVKFDKYGEKSFMEDAQQLEYI